MHILFIIVLGNVPVKKVSSGDAGSFIYHGNCLQGIVVGGNDRQFPSKC